MAKDEGKLRSVIALLSQDARDRLRVFLRSPWFNRSIPVRAMADHYLQQLTDGAAASSAQDLFQVLFPTETFEALKLKNLRAALQRKLDDFLVQESLARDVGGQQRLLLAELNVLNESQHFHKYHLRALERVHAAPIVEEHRQLALFGIAEEREEAQTRLHDRSQGATDTSAYYHAWQFFQLQTLKFLVRQANVGAMTGPSADTSRAEAILPLIDDGEQAMPALQLYRSLLDVFRNPQDFEVFAKLRKRLLQYGGAVSAPDASDVYTGAINHCIRRINGGAADFAPVMLELYQEMHAMDLLQSNGRLRAPQFKNMIGLALRFQAYEWAQMIIDSYGHRLDQDPHGNATAFNQGMLYFSQRNYAGAERCFHQVLQAYEDVFMGLDARSYLLRIYYEEGNWTGLESLAESFKMYLKRNKRIPKGHRDSYLHTARFFGKLAKASGWSQKRLLRLRAEIEEATFGTISKLWLLQKLDARIK